MMKKPLTLSIVIPAYNEERHLKTCLDSIASQTQKPDEVVLVNNNSTDGTAAIARKYSFVRIVDEKKQGIAHARNAGFDAARSDILGRIDADTILPSDWVQEVKHFFMKYGDSVVFSGSGYFYNLRFGRLVGKFYDTLVHRINRMLVGHYFPWGSNTALTSKAWQEIRAKVCTRSDIHEDLDLGIHLGDAGYNVHFQFDSHVGARAQHVLKGRHALWRYLAMWPRTLRIHHMRVWVLCWPVAVFVRLGSVGIYLMESSARFVDKLHGRSRSSLEHNFLKRFITGRHLK